MNKNALRAGTISSAVTLLLVTASPAIAVMRDDGDEPGAGLSVAETLGLFVGLPVLIFLLIAGAVMLPSVSGRKR